MTSVSGVIDGTAEVVKTEDGKPEFTFEALEKFQPGVERIVVFAADLVITNDDEAENVTEVLARIAKQRKDVNSERMTITRPLEAEKKAAIAKERELLDPLDPIDKMLRKGLEEYHVAKREAARREEERIEAERKAREEEAAQAALEAEREARRREYEAGRRKTSEAQQRQEEAAEAAHAAAEAARQAEAVAKHSPSAEVEQVRGPVKSSSGSSSVSEVWVAEVVDPEKVPDKFKQVVQSKVNAAMRAAISDDKESCAIEIPGVEIKRVPRAAVRTS